MGETPRHRVVILGAGRVVAGNLPAAMVSVDEHRRVLDWLLAGFSVLRGPQIHCVVGYRADAIVTQYPDIRFSFNPDWEVTGPARSLALVPLGAGTSTFVSYSDVLFRPDSVRRMEMQENDLVIAVDRRWRVRYDARSRSDLDSAEKVLLDGNVVVDIGARVATPEADAEFTGLLKLSAPAALRLEDALRAGLFRAGAGLPEIIRHMIQEGASVGVVDVDGDWAELNAPQDLARFVLGTKAESLERLKSLVRRAEIGDLVAFTHQHWQSERAALVHRSQAVFGGASLIVRSSALGEDNWLQSRAGAYKSIPGVPGDDAEALATAIDEVFTSYGAPHADNQVFVQEMLENVSISGVVMTRTPTVGAPYYVVNFDSVSGQTDTVTSGVGPTLRTVFLKRRAELRPDLPPVLGEVLEMVSELERLVGHDSLDIEFAVPQDGRCRILQVRPIAVAHRDQRIDDDAIAEGIEEAIRSFRELQKPSPLLVGSSTLFSVMSDWNPAEMIGTKPGRLAFSLYRYLITDETWAQQRAEYGYRDVRPCNLIVDFLGHPYVDLRVDFGSFVPASLPEDLATRLVDHYLVHLSSAPELHDKVEFKVLFTCLTFDFEASAQRLRGAGFSAHDVAQLRASLLEITHNGIGRCDRDLAQIETLKRRFDAIATGDVDPLERAFLSLADARRLGIPAFSHLARNAFVAVSLLRSLAATGSLSEKDVEAFLASLRTVPAAMQEHSAQVAAGELSWDEFVAHYGHLRPGSYDITSPCYASAAESFLRPMLQAPAATRLAAADDPWDEPTRDAIRAELTRSELGVDLESFERFLRTAIEGREFAKFAFTRNLSAALEALAEFGAAYGVSREELAHVSIEGFFELRGAPTHEVGTALRRRARFGREASYTTQAVCLPALLESETDFVCFEQRKAEPNYVTRKKICAEVVCVSRDQSADTDLTGKIILVPNADPGFDWLFARQIAGLVTMYGGLNSHMAIRAAEFELPAAIGVGELLYEDVSQARLIELDCASRQIQVVQ